MFDDLFERLIHYYFENGKVIFWFFTFPLFAQMLQQNIPEKAIKGLMISSGILVTPVLTGYFYIIPNFYEVLIYILIAGLYALKNEDIWFSSTLKLAGKLFLILGFFTLITLTGFIKVEKQWKIKNYIIEYRKDQGFAGGPLMTYKLSKLGLIPLFAKHIETVTDDDTLQNCNIKFAVNRIIFNKCEETIKENTH